MIHQFLFEPIHDLSQITWVREVSLILSNQITYAVLVLACVWAIFYSRRKMYSFSLILLTMITAWFTSNLIKVLIRAPRPYIEMGFTPVELETGFSFPSSHTTVLFALAFALSFLNPRYGKIVLFFAVLIGASRVILGVHYPIDVLGGIILGYLVYRLYRKIFSKL